MDTLKRRKLRANYVMLVRNLDPEDVIDYLYQESVLNENDRDNISSMPTRAQRVRILLDILPKRRGNSFEKLVSALTDSGYTELVALLEAPSDYSGVDKSDDIQPCSESLPMEDPKLIEMREQLEQQAQVVASIQKEMEQLRLDLKRVSETEDSEKYKQTVLVLNELEKEKSKKEEVYKEVYQILLKDISREDRSSKLIQSNTNIQSTTLGTEKKSSRNGIKLARNPSCCAIKCVLLGDGAVGKTSIINYFLKKQRMDHYIPTIFDNHSLTISEGNSVVTVNFWDTAGQEDYDKLRPLCYSESDVALLVFNIASAATLNNILAKWYPEFRHYCRKTPVIVVGNKTDQIIHSEKEHGWKFIKKHEADKVAESIGAAGGLSFLCSAFTGDGIEDLLKGLLKVGIKQMTKAKRKQMPCSCS